VIDLHAEDAERCAMTDEVSAEIGPGNSGRDLAAVAIGLESSYVTQALQSLPGGRVTLCLTGELDPMRIECQDEPGYIGIIMPRRI
jgi:DNA polymerase III sliding clamp (beta) subunit (PCNA family)